MPSPKDIQADKLIMAAAAKLKEEIERPEWAKFVKTGVGRERPPQQEDWWQIRAASMLRKIYLGEPVGVQRLRKIYGNRKNNGHQPEHKALAAGKITRVMLQQLEAKGYLKKEKTKGRAITPKGQAFLQAAAKAA